MGMKMHCDQCDRIVVTEAGPAYVGMVQVHVLVNAAEQKPDVLEGDYCSKKCARIAVSKILADKL